MPRERTLEEIASALERLIDPPLEELPEGDWRSDKQRYRDENFGRGSLVVETDDEYGQVYLAGRTHTPAFQRAWGSGS